jgi:muramoyltetrapeptide carboxypeptidase
MTPSIAPPKLMPGDRVALVSPARWPTEPHVTGLVAALQRHGLIPGLHPQMNAQYLFDGGRVGQLAGSDELRAAAFNEVLADPTIKAIFFPRAGTGSYRILDRIDYAAAAAHPKIVMGFSDVDILLSALYQRSGLITFRGPLGVSFAGKDMDPRTESECFALLSGQKTEWDWTGATALHEGVAEGIMVGGNIAVLNANIGTPDEVDTDGKIVVLEECDELLFRLDRFLYQASRAGKFSRARAVLFGTIENMLDGEQHDGSGSPFGEDVPAMLRRWVPDHVPLVHGLPLGHGAYLSSHPIGARVRVEIGRSVTKLKLLEPVVS